MTTTKPKSPAEVLALVTYHPDELTAYHANARRGDTTAIARSLETNGQYRPIVVNLGRHTGRPLEVLAGNHTLAAARQLGWTKIAATTVDVDDQQAARIVAADNRLADLGDYDDAALLALLQDAGDLDGTGYTDTDLEALLNTDTDDEPDEDAPIEDIPPVYGVVVECRDERQQTDLLERLIAEGHTVRALS